MTEPKTRPKLPPPVCEWCGGRVPRRPAKFCSRACYFAHHSQGTECTVEDCSRRSRRKGLCAKHDERLRRTGNLSARTDLTVPDKFWQRVQIGEPDECWPWRGPIQTGKHGYGFFFLTEVPKPTRILAHRFAYMLATGEDVRGWVVMHSCDNPPCVNPNHLKRGTQKDNVADMDAKGRRVVAGAVLNNRRSA